MITLEIATPEKVVYKDTIKQVSLPTELGEITILPGHLPLVANLVAGELRIVKNDEIQPYAVSGGFVEVRTGNHVVVLADAAEHIEEIDEARAEAARKRAQKLMEEAKGDDIRFAEGAALLERSLSRLRLARKKKYRDSRPPQV